MRSFAIFFARRSYPVKAELRSSSLRGFDNLAILFHASAELSQCLYWNFNAFQSLAKRLTKTIFALTLTALLLSSFHFLGKD